VQRIFSRDEFLDKKPVFFNQKIYAMKLTYGSVEFQKFFRAGIRAGNCAIETKILDPSLAWPIRLIAMHKSRSLKPQKSNFELLGPSW
jgi:hypothetical protein